MSNFEQIHSALRRWRAPDLNSACGNGNVARQNAKPASWLTSISSSETRRSKMTSLACWLRRF